MSTMREAADTLTENIAGNLRQLREAGGHSLDALAVKSGVSRSMISLIERGESSPTAVVLDKLARAFGVTLASLFDRASGESPVPSPVSRREDRSPWRDPESGYVRCNISPPGVLHPMQIVEVHFPAGARVAF